MCRRGQRVFEHITVSVLRIFVVCRVSTALRAASREDCKFLVCFLPESMSSLEHASNGKDLCLKNCLNFGLQYFGDFCLIYSVNLRKMHASNQTTITLLMFSSTESGNTIWIGGKQYALWGKMTHFQQ